MTDTSHHLSNDALLNDPRLAAVLDNQPYPLLFVTISGAHSYGFASADSDFDLRGVHLLPAREALSLFAPKDTIERTAPPEQDPTLDLDLVTYDAAKFMTLMLKKNGAVLEQLYSPLVLHTSEAHTQLKTLGKGCITRHHVHHYLGFSLNQWKLFRKEQVPRVKPLLYTYRTVLTGIHLMRTGEIEADLRRLNEVFGLSYIDDLIAAKRDGAEKQPLPDADLTFHEQEFARLEAVLREADDTSHLPEKATAKQGLSDLLVELRLGMVDRDG